MTIGNSVDPERFKNDRDLAVVSVTETRNEKFIEALKQAMQRRHDCVSYGVGEDLETIGVAFPHVILTGREWLNDEVGDVREALREAFGRYVDPGMGLRVSYFKPSGAWEDACAAFFGRGVFLPEQQDQLIGVARVQRYDAQGRSIIGRPTPVRLLGPSGQDKAAGFYRGQTGLAFSHYNSRMAAAEADVHDPARGEADAVIFHLAPPRDGSSQPHLLCIDSKNRAREPAAHLYSREPGVLGASNADEGLVAIDVKKRGVNLFQVAYSYDARASRLRAEPDEGDLLIAGIAAPEDPFISAWWLNLDAQQRLVAHSAASAARTIVCEGSHTASYSWISKPARFDGHQGWTLTTSRFSRAPSVLAPKSYGAAMGYLKPPEETRPASFEQSSGDAYELDWLDWAGAVRRPGGAADRLGRHWAKVDHKNARKTGRTAMMPGLRPPSQAEARMVLARSAKKGGAFGPWNGTRDDVEFRVGPLLLRPFMKKAAP